MRMRSASTAMRFEGGWYLVCFQSCGSSLGNLAPQAAGVHRLHALSIHPLLGILHGTPGQQSDPTRRQSSQSSGDESQRPIRPLGVKVTGRPSTHSESRTHSSDSTANYCTVPPSFSSPTQTAAHSRVASFTSYQKRFLKPYTANGYV
jgi:hypothetical protein